MNDLRSAYLLTAAASQLNHSMLMTMVNVRIMRVTVPHWFVSMHMAVRLRQELWLAVMLVMLVMTVQMIVLHRVM